MNAFENEIRDKLLKRLNLTHVDPATVTSETALFGEGGLGLDSLDALEIAILVEQEYGITIAVAERNRAVMGSLGNLAGFVQQNLHRDKKP
jgi:acyl carrier protein